MKASYNWLKDYCEFDLPAHELARRMSHAGLNVDSYEPRDDDWMLDVEVKSNRPDCLSHIGIAREIAALTARTVAVPEVLVREDPDESFDDLSAVEVTAPDLCPHYTARIIRGVKVGPSPEWLRRRLETCGLRPVNNVVDVTNYVMYECGQPLHSFDLSLLDESRIVVRRARDGESITTIDGSLVKLSGDECVIADASRPVALAGVMGGAESEIRETTADVLLESARFDPANNRRTSRRHMVASDSSYRYQRGIDPEITEWASRRACALILELAGGRLLKGAAEVRADTTEEPEVALRFSRLSQLLGHDVPSDVVLTIFRGLGLSVVDARDSAVTVRVPSWRSDLRREVDLVEEVVRIHGYDKVGETTQMPVRPVRMPTQDLAERRARRLVAGAGFHEVMTFSLVPDAPLQRAQPWTGAEPLAVRNPITVDRTHLRVTNLANLLRVKAYNQAQGSVDVDLFELGHVFIPRSGEKLPEEQLCLTVLTDREEGLRVLKGLLTNLLSALGIRDVPEQVPADRPPFAPGAAVELRMGDALLGVAGVLAQETADELDLRHCPALLEADFGLLVGACRLDAPYRAVPQFPATRRDLAVVVDEDVLWRDISKCIAGAASELLESVDFFDIYRGDPVPEHHKSVAFTLTFRRPDRTMTAEDADEATAAILAALKAGLNASLR
jgi:phenylalanyl-tRNA synthetase beta chain